MWSSTPHPGCSPEQDPGGARGHRDDYSGRDPALLLGCEPGGTSSTICPTDHDQALGAPRPEWGMRRQRSRLIDTVAFYISGHGFGHASRQIEIIKALRNLAPEVGLLIRTSAPKWLFDRSLGHGFVFLAGEPDTGVVQRDNLRIDPPASLERAWAFHQSLNARADTEAHLLERHAVTLVVADIPPLAFATARTAGLPAVGISNFTWDWIYANYRSRVPLPPQLLPTIEDAYATAELAWRLPMAGGFATFPDVRDAPLVARHASRRPGETRQALGLPITEPLVLLSFGRYGLDAIDWTTVAQQDHFHVVVTRDPANAGRADLDANTAATIHHVNVPTLVEHGLQYVDLVAAVDVVLTKPGYGIISECVANDTALIYTPRGDFAEYPVLVDAMPSLLRCTYMSHDDLFAGRWSASLHKVLDQPVLPRVPTNGALVLARWLVTRLAAQRK